MKKNSFQNFVEWTLALPLTGYDSGKLIKCETYKYDCFEYQLKSVGSFGRRPVNTDSTRLDDHFVPQVLNCKICDRNG